MKRIIGRVPDPSKIPYGLMMINVWTDDPNPREGVIRSSSAKRYQSSTDYWHRDRDYTDKLDLEADYDWSFDGYRIGDFQIGLYENQGVPEEVLEAVKLLESWREKSVPLD
jgi:hypothetical protein